MQDKLQQLYNHLIAFKKHKFNQYNWDMNARPEQKIPDTDWSTWCIIAGRGFGKTRTGAEAIKQFVNNGYKRIGFIGASLNEVRNIMIEGESGLLSIYSNKSDVQYYPSINLLKWSNGARGYIISADKPDSIRGHQFDLIWIDEFAKFYKPDECWHQLGLALRLGQKPRAIITTTPKPIKILQHIMSQRTTHCTHGSTYDNKHLSEEFMNNLKNAYGDTSFAAQEIYGQMLEQYNLWAPQNIRYHNLVDTPVNFDKINISVDPAMTSNDHSDETGIVIIGYKDDKYYVLEDASVKAPPKIWMQNIANLYQQYNANNVIVEINQGGDLLKEMLHQYGIKNIIEVRASESKFVRAQKAFMLYEKGLVYHIKQFDTLESQMLSMQQNHNKKSPDRLDALTWGLISCVKQSMQSIIEVW